MPEIKNVDNTNINTRKGDFDVQDSSNATNMQMRAVDAVRMAEHAELAAELARKKGLIDKAEELEQAAERLRAMAENYLNRDDKSELGNSDNNKEEESGNSNNNDEESGNEDDFDTEDNNESEEEANEDDELDNESNSSSDNDNNNSNETNKSDNKDSKDSKNGNEENSSENKNNSKANTSNENGKEDKKDNSKSNESDKNSEASEDDKENKDKNKDDNNTKSKKGNSSNKGDNEENENNNNENEDSDDDSEDNEEKENNSENIPNPFKLPDKGQQGKGKQVSHDALMKKIKEIFATLTPDEKKRVKGDINSILTDRGEKLTDSLHEDLDKDITEYTDDEFDDELNKVVDLITEVEGKEGIINTKEQRAKVKQWADRPSAWKELQQEININAKKELKKKRKANEHEIDRYNYIGTISEFELDFYETIKEQVQMELVDDQSYDEINTEYEDEDVVLKADVRHEKPTVSKPIVDLYFDMSGSWTGDKKAVEIGKSVVATIAEFANKGQIELHILYFSSADRDGFATTYTDPRLGKGTTSWQAIRENIEATGATNVVLMTDGDMNGQASYQPACEIDGYVWFIWKNGEVGPEIIKKLRGTLGSSQYSFNSYE